MDHVPLSTLNESDILLSHKPDPLSYWQHDWDSPHSSSRAIAAMHVFSACFAFWFMLPAVIAMRIARSPWRPLVQLAFLLTVVLSTIAGLSYRKLTPDLYQGSKHGAIGYITVFLTGGLSLVEALSSFLCRPDPDAESRPWHTVLARFVPSHLTAFRRSYSKVSPLDDVEQDSLKAFLHDPAHQRHHVRFDSVDLDSPRTTFDDLRSESTLDGMSHLSRVNSLDSDLESPSRGLSSRAGHHVFIALERSLVIIAFIQFLSGASVYTGICRGNYLNGCLAHMIKGGIFWAYGLLTFARFLGAYADMGWAWNYLPPAIRPVTAEFVECSIIFLYGATNTWMERFGAEAGSSFTTKQVQHISIAIMFWFGGMVGMAIESRTFRRWLGSAAAMSIKPGSDIIEPKAYSGSFNPVPAVVIGITGAAMGAHHQTYMFQVQIHALWGNFLVGFAILRCLTYFFVWLRPAHSILPSRPPTELVASFLLSCGGLTFIFSSEQITFAAMRRDHADVMMFLNLAAAITFLAFCWILAVLSFKGWLTQKGRALE